MWPNINWFTFGCKLKSPFIVQLFYLGFGFGFGCESHIHEFCKLLPKIILDDFNSFWISLPIGSLWALQPHVLPSLAFLVMSGWYISILVMCSMRVTGQFRVGVKVEKWMNERDKVWVNKSSFISLQERCLEDVNVAPNLRTTASSEIWERKSILWKLSIYFILLVLELLKEEVLRYLHGKNEWPYDCGNLGFFLPKAFCSKAFQIKDHKRVSPSNKRWALLNIRQPHLSRRLAWDILPLAVSKPHIKWKWKSSPGCKRDDPRVPREHLCSCQKCIDLVGKILHKHLLFKSSLERTTLKFVYPREKRPSRFHFRGP